MSKEEAVAEKCGPRRFASRYIVDVVIDKQDIQLIDSGHNIYHVNADDAECVSQFKQWFGNVFCKGISGTLTLFEYNIIKLDEHESACVITKFLKTTI